MVDGYFEMHHQYDNFKERPIFVHVNMHGFRWNFCGPKLKLHLKLFERPSLSRNTNFDHNDIIIDVAQHDFEYCLLCLAEDVSKSKF